MPKSKRRPQTKVKISGDGDVTFTGGDVHIELPPNITPPHGDKSDLDADISTQKGGKVDFVSGTRFDYAETNFSAAIKTLETLLIPVLQETQVERARKTINDLQDEGSKASPDQGHVRSLLSDLIQLAQLIPLVGPAVEEVHKAIRAIGMIFGISL